MSGEVAHDVIVVGAGFAGLTAARALAAAGVDVLVLEGADRVGGRTDSVVHGGRLLELGGQWTGPGQGHVAALAAELGVTLFDTPHEGADVLLRDGHVCLAAEDPVSPLVVQAVSHLDGLAAALEFDDPSSPAAAEADRLTAARWLEDEIDHPDVRRALRHTLEGLMTTSASDMSLLTVLHAARTSGTMAAALGIEGGAQEQRVQGGMHGLAMRMAEQLGERVRLGTPVMSVDQQRLPDAVVVRVDGGEYRATRVIVAVPPSAWPAIEFDPMLPEAHRELPAVMPMGSVIKAQLVYEQPFWRSAGWSGLVIDDTGPFGFVADNGTPDDDAGVLVSFLSADAAREWGDARLGSEGPGLRRRRLLEHVASAFGDDAPAPIDYLDRDWSAVSWIGGGYSGVMRPGGWGRCGSALREPVGRVHWASSESATMWTGYVDGAMQSGMRAAREVLELTSTRDLGPETTPPGGLSLRE